VLNAVKKGGVPRMVGSAPAVDLKVMMPGQYRDGESGLADNGHRSFISSLGRYMQPDPIRQRGGLNLFLYGKASPLVFTDAMGLRSTGWDWLDKMMQPYSTSQCATAECAAGLLPARVDNRTIPEIERSMCMEICRPVEAITAAACGVASNIVLPGGSLAISLINLKAGPLICKRVCL
jgi:RHS repeat-associated protein